MCQVSRAHAATAATATTTTRSRIVSMIAEIRPNLASNYCQETLPLPLSPGTATGMKDSTVIINPSELYNTINDHNPSTRTRTNSSSSNSSSSSSSSSHCKLAEEDCYCRWSPICMCAFLAPLSFVGM